MPTSAAALGRVLTFYSYKGGTGRSMAMANVAWILASAGRRVLAIDWDLEAPGLHRYFRPFLIDDELTASEGLMDLVDNYAVAAIQPVGDEKPHAQWYLPHTDISDYIVTINFPHFREGGRIDFMPAGRQGEQYATMVSSFNWQNFYDRLGGGGFFEALKARARSQYDYILIDSRTGVSDTAGICSVQMPDTLVVCFTYNNQSIKGASGIARSARAMHDKLVAEKLALLRAGKIAENPSDITRPYRVFPVPMRVDSGESERLVIRQAFAQHAFRDLTDHLGSDSTRYWKSVEVPQTSFYSYEEVLATFKDDPYDPKTILAAILTLTRHITDGDVADFRMPIAPETKQEYLEAFAETVVTTGVKTALAESQRESEEQVLVRNAEAALATLRRSDLEDARRILCRLVRIGSDADGVRYTPTRVKRGEFSTAQQPIIDRLASHRVLVLPPTSSEGESTVSLADSRLLANWPLLIEWLEKDHEFLAWRQRLQHYLADWERSARDRGALLNGRLLSEADLRALKRGDDLNDAEKRYIEESRKAAASRPSEPLVAAAAAPAGGWRRFAGVAAAVAIIVVVALITMRPYSEPAPPGPSANVTAPPPLTTPVPAPQFVGLSAHDAQVLADRYGLKLEPTGGTAAAGPLSLVGVVIDQSPAAGDPIAPGNAIRLTLAQRTARAPTVVGMDLTAALKVLESAQLKLGSTGSVYVPDAKAGSIVTQTPTAGSELGIGTPVDVVVARAAQLTDFRFGIYFVDASAESKMLAERIATFLRQQETTGELLPRDAPFFASRLGSPERHEIRYSTPVERRMAEQVMAGLKKAGRFPAFSLRQVTLKSEGFISIVVADAGPRVSMTIVGYPGQDVQVWYRGDREGGEAPIIFTGKIGSDGRVVVSVPRAYLLVGRPTRRDGMPVNLQNTRDTQVTVRFAAARK